MAASGGTGAHWTRHGAIVAGVVAAVIGIVAVVWWAWPTLTGRDDQLGVLVLADPFLDGARQPIEERTREVGRSVRWLPFDDAWCDDPLALSRAVDDLDPARVVLSFAAGAACVGPVAGALEGRAAVAVAEPGVGPAPADLAAAGFDVVDPERFIGRLGDDPRRRCEWWDDCDGDGRIAVRDGAGALSPAGGERVARMVVAAL